MFLKWQQWTGHATGFYGQLHIICPDKSSKPLFSQNDLLAFIDRTDMLHFPLPVFIVQPRNFLGATCNKGSVGNDFVAGGFCRVQDQTGPLLPCCQLQFT